MTLNAIAINPKSSRFNKRDSTNVQIKPIACNNILEFVAQTVDRRIFPFVVFFIVSKGVSGPNLYYLLMLFVALVVDWLIFTSHPLGCMCVVK